MLTLKFFNSVMKKQSFEPPFISVEGYIIEPQAMWAKDQIISYYRKEKLNGNDLNKTFHKSWKKIQDSTRFELYIDQILHYVSAQGSVSDAPYFPDEVLEVPDFDLTYKVIKALPKEELVEKALNILRSGIALDSETIDDIIAMLVDELSYTFTNHERIRNMEAVVKIADLTNILPTDAAEFLRYLVYQSIGASLLIKNNDTVQAIQAASFDPAPLMKTFGLEKLAAIFNRFKPIFLAYKKKCPKTINRISKLSKRYHVPMVSNPLNKVTCRILRNDELHWLDNATPFALFKALSTLWVRINGKNAFVYRIRNGKSWTTEKRNIQVKPLEINFETILEYVKDRFNMVGEKFFFPADIEFALPTSEKMFVGNFPTGTSFSGKKVAVGIYWKNSWGAHDLDLSGLNVGKKVGWNSTYSLKEGSLMFSGDIINAPKGAVEYLYAAGGLSEPTLVFNNVYNGQNDAKFKIIVGKGDKITKRFMMNPGNLFMEVSTKMPQKQAILGILIPKENMHEQKFVLLNFGSGTLRVSDGSKLNELATKALFQQWNNAFSFQKLITLLGGEIVENREDANYDFSLDTLEKDSFIKLFQD